MFAIQIIDERRLAAWVQRPLRDIGSVWGAFWEAAHEAPGKASRLVVGVFQTSDLAAGPAGIAWYGAGVVLQEGDVVPPSLEELRVEGGPYAVVAYRGPWDGLPQAWGEFVGALQRDGIALDLGRPCYEVYVEGGRDGAAPLTELCVPVRG